MARSSEKKMEEQWMENLYYLYNYISTSLHSISFTLSIVQHSISFTLNVTPLHAFHTLNVTPLHAFHALNVTPFPLQIKHTLNLTQSHHTAPFNTISILNSTFQLHLLRVDLTPVKYKGG